MPLSLMPLHNGQACAGVDTAMANSAEAAVSAGTTMDLNDFMARLS